MSNGEERKKKKRKRPFSEDGKADNDKQPKASETNQNGDNLDNKTHEQRPNESLAGPEIHLCKALLEGKVRQYIVLKELSDELGNKAAELVNTSESRIQAFLESYKQGETATSQTRALAESLEQISHALQGFCSSQDIPKFPLTPALLLVFAWAIFHDGVEWDAANKRKLMEMLDTIQSHGNKPFVDARPKAIQANQQLFVYTMLDTESYEGLMTATESTLERYKKLTGYQEKPSYQSTTAPKEEEDSSDAEVASSLLAGKQPMSSSQYSQSRASSSKDSKRGYESSASYEGSTERTSRPNLKRKSKRSESTSREVSKKGKSTHRTEDNQPIASTSAVTLELTNERVPSQKQKRPRPSASGSSASSNPTKQEKSALHVGHTRPTSTSPRPAKRRLVAPPSPPAEAEDLTVVNSTTVVLETDSEKSDQNIEETVIAKRRSAAEVKETEALKVLESVVSEGRKPPPVGLEPILPLSPSPSVRPDLSASSEADNVTLAKSPFDAATPTSAPNSGAGRETLQPNKSIAHERTEVVTSSTSVASAVKQKPTGRIHDPVQNIRVIEIFDSDEEEEAAIAAIKELDVEPAKDPEQEQASGDVKPKHPAQEEREVEEDTGPNVAGIRTQTSAYVSESEEEIDELEEDAAFIEPQPTIAVPTPLKASETSNASNPLASAAPASSEVARAQEPLIRALAPGPPRELPSISVPSQSTSRVPTPVISVIPRATSARPTLHPPSTASNSSAPSTSMNRLGQTKSSELTPTTNQASSRDLKGKGKAPMEDPQQVTPALIASSVQHRVGLPSSHMPTADATVQTRIAPATSSNVRVDLTQTRSDLSSSKAEANLPTKGAQAPLRDRAIVQKPVTDIAIAPAAQGNAPISAASSQASTSKPSNNGLLLASHPPPAKVEPFEAIEDRWDTVFDELEQHVWDALDRTSSQEAEDVQELRRDEEEYHAEQHNMKRALKAYTQARNRRRKARRSATIEKLKQQQAEQARLASQPQASSAPIQDKTSNPMALSVAPRPTAGTTLHSAPAQDSSSTPVTASGLSVQAFGQPSTSTFAIHPPEKTSTAQDRLQQGSSQPQVNAAHSQGANAVVQAANIDTRAQEILQRLTKGKSSGRPLAQQIADRIKSSELVAEPPANAIITTVPPGRIGPSVELPQTLEQAQVGSQQEGTGKKNAETHSSQATSHAVQPATQSNQPVPVDRLPTLQIRPRFPDFSASIKRPTLATELRVPGPVHFNILPHISGPQQPANQAGPSAANVNTNLAALPSQGLPSSLPATTNDVSDAAGQARIQPQSSETGIDPRSTVIARPSDSASHTGRTGEELRRSVPPLSRLEPRPGGLNRSVHGTSALQPPITSPFAPQSAQQRIPAFNNASALPGTQIVGSTTTSALQKPEVDLQQSHRRHVSLDHPIWRHMAQMRSSTGTTSLTALSNSDQAVNAIPTTTSGISPQRADTVSPAVITDPTRQISTQQSIRHASVEPIPGSSNISTTQVGSGRPNFVTPGATTSHVRSQSSSGRQSAEASAPQTSTVPIPQTAPPHMQPRPAGFGSSHSQISQPRTSEAQTQQQYKSYFQQMQMIAQQHQMQGVGLQSQGSALPNHLQRSANGRAMSPPGPVGGSQTGRPQTPITTSSASQQSPQQHQTSSPPLVQTAGQGQHAGQRQQPTHSQRGFPQHPEYTIAQQQIGQMIPQQQQPRSGPPASGFAQGQSQLLQGQSTPSQQQIQRQQSPPQQITSQQAGPSPQQASFQQQAQVQQAGSPQVQLSRSQQGQARPPPPPIHLQPYPVGQRPQQASTSRQVAQAAPVLPFRQGDLMNWISRQNMIEQTAAAHGERGNFNSIENAANFFASTGFNAEEVSQFRSRAYFLLAMKSNMGPLPPG